MVENIMLKLVASSPVLIFSKKNEKCFYGDGGYGESSYVGKEPQNGDLKDIF